jgi:sulfur-oxidizing protein SoxY
MNRFVASLLMGLCLVVAGVGAGGVAWGAVGGLPTATRDDDTSPEWESLRGKLFAGRQIIPMSRGRVRLEVPIRAQFGASVPVKVTSMYPQDPELFVKRMYLIVDKNPSKIAATIDFTVDVGQADVETRLRVDEYGHIRAIVELSDGQLHMDSRYVKVSGGCSAPPNRDQLDQIGRTVLRVPDTIALKNVTPFNVMVRHPNDTGFELNHISVMYIPPHFIRTINISYDGKMIIKADIDFSISENPNFKFNFIPAREGELRADVEDSRENKFVGRVAVRSSL